MQEQSKFNLKINIIPNGLEKNMNFTISNKLIFINSFQLEIGISLLDSLVKNLGKDDFKNLIQEFGNNVLGLIKQKDFVLISIEYKSCVAKNSNNSID